MSTEIQAWLGARLPQDWFVEPATITVDRDEITVIGRVAAPDEASDAAQPERTAAQEGRIARFREQTREERIGIAREAERRFERKVAWGATCGDTERRFTALAAPVMTRLRQPERIVLDTLVDAGVARSRSHALAWCVRLVGEHSGDWLGQLREALTDVERLREAGPEAAAG
jgi:hypothetical protein